MGGLKKPLSLKGFNHLSFEPIHWLAKYSILSIALRELAVRWFFLVQKSPVYLIVILVMVKMQILNTLSYFPENWNILQDWGGTLWHSNHWSSKKIYRQKDFCSSHCWWKWKISWHLCKVWCDCKIPHYESIQLK